MSAESTPQFWPKCGHVQLTKMEATRDLDGMLPTDYWLRGNLFAPLIVGEPIHVARYERAGREPHEPEVVQTAGLFESSPVQRIERLSCTTANLYTQNSVWRIEFLPAQPLETDAINAITGNIT